MLRRSLRTSAASLVLVGAAFAFAPAAHAQDATTETTVAVVAETAAVVEPVAEVEPVAAAPEGGVAAGGGFLGDENGSTPVLPIALAAAAAAAGAGVFVARRRKA